MKLDRETWTFINSFAPWLSAIGTLAAVIFSLYVTLADRTRLRVWAWKKTLPFEARTVPVPGDDDDDEHSAVIIRIVNTRDKEAFVDGIYWRVGTARVPQSTDYQLVSGWDLKGRSMLLGRAPTEIAFDLRTFQTYYLPNIAPLLSNSSRPIKIGVRTPNGKRFESQVDRPLEDWLRQASKLMSET